MISEERSPGLEEKVLIISIAIGHSLDYFDLVVHSFDDTGVKVPLAMADDSR